MEGLLWKMKKAAYGLCDASRKFWQRVMDLLIEIGCKPLAGDETLLYFHSGGRLEGIVCLHVDDILGGGTVKLKEEVMERIAKEYACSKREKNVFRYTGVDVERDKNGYVFVSQEAYVDNIEEVKKKHSDDNRRPLNKEEFKEFQGG